MIFGVVWTGEYRKGSDLNESEDVENGQVGEPYDDTAGVPNCRDCDLVIGTASAAVGNGTDGDTEKLIGDTDRVPPPGIRPDMKFISQTNASSASSSST